MATVDKVPPEKEPQQRTEKSAQDVARLNRITTDIDRLDTWANTGADNGLFSQPGVKVSYYEDFQKSLDQARNFLASNKLPEAESGLSQAIYHYSNALHSTSKSWRFFNVYGVHIWVYLVGFLVGIFLFYYFGLDQQLSKKLIATPGDQNASQIQSAIHVATWGCIGAILRGLWYLKARVDDRQWRNSWTIYFLSAPFLGGILGSIVYILIIGGLFSITGKTNVDVSNQLAIIPFAGLAGFNWEWAVETFRRIGGLLALTKSQGDEKIPK